MSAIPRVSKPRKPRNRAAKRSVAPPGYNAYPRGLYSFSLIQRNKHALISGILPDAPLRMTGTRLSLKEAEDRFIAALADLASSYRRWRRQLPGGKSEARYQLQCLASLAGDFATLSDTDRHRLLALMHPSNDLARAAMWAGLLRHLEWPSADVSPVTWLQSEMINWVLVSEAAMDAADRLQTGGDYSDRTLALAIQLLADIFTEYTGQRLTVNKGHDRPSPVNRLARTFFAIVDPRIAERTIDIGLDRLRRARNRKVRSAQSFQPAFLTR